MSTDFTETCSMSFGELAQRGGTATGAAVVVRVALTHGVASAEHSPLPRLNRAELAEFGSCWREPRACSSGGAAWTLRPGHWSRERIDTLSLADVRSLLQARDVLDVMLLDAIDSPGRWCSRAALAPNCWVCIRSVLYRRMSVPGRRPWSTSRRRGDGSWMISLSARRRSANWRASWCLGVQAVGAAVPVL